MKRLWAAAESFDPRGLPLSLSRSLLAMAQLAFVAFTPDRFLLLSSPAIARSSCTGTAGLTLWCVTPASQMCDALNRVFVLLVLFGVLVGFRPRWLCIPHWYVSFSIAVDVTIADGGTAVAQIMTALLIPACLADERVWHWRRAAGPMPAAWRGSSYAAHLVMRVQVAVIYVTAALSKLAYPSWRNGTALRTLAASPQYGAAPAIRSLVERLLAPHAVTATVTWAAVVSELSIGLSALLPAGFRRRGLVLAVCLHASIIVGLGLFSFGLTMIALLLSVQATASSERPSTRSSIPESRKTHSDDFIHDHSAGSIQNLRVGLESVSSALDVGVRAGVPVDRPTGL